MDETSFPFPAEFDPQRSQDEIRRQDLPISTTRGAQISMHPLPVQPHRFYGHPRPR